MEVYILIQNDSLPKLLGEDVLHLAATSKSMFHQLSEFIYNHFVFWFVGKENTFKCYKPTQMRVGGYFGADPLMNFTPESPFDDFTYIDDEGKEIIARRPELAAVRLPSKHFEINLDLLPSTLTHLTFGPHFNLPIDHLLPQSLTHLVFEDDSSFNHPVDHLPPGLLHLELQGSFNRPVDHLPQGLLHLVLSKEFNQPVDHLPPSLQSITFGSYFLQSINALPASLTHLQIPLYFLDISSLPPKLSSLKMTSAPNLSDLNVILPPTLTFLYTSQSFPSNTHFPDSLQKLGLVGETQFEGKLPCNLKHLFLNVDQPTISNLPPTLERLNLLGQEESPYLIDALPPNLKDLSLHYPASIPDPLPATLEKFTLICDEFYSFASMLSILSLPNLTTFTFVCSKWSTGHIQRDTPISLPPKLTSISFTLDYTSDNFASFINNIDFASSSLEHVRILANELRVYIDSDSPPEDYTITIRQLPPFLISLKLRNVVLALQQLPQTLQQLTTSFENFLGKLPLLPDNLSLLDCTYCELPPILPSNLKDFSIVNCTNPVPPLPSSLQTLYLRGNHEIETYPCSLRKLLAEDITLSPATKVPPGIRSVLVKHSPELPEFPLTLNKLELTE